MAKTVLVVDDDTEIADFATLALRSAGYRVLTAFDGEQALRMARSEKPDLVLLDLAMPRMHGYEVCQALRADQALSRVKIIIASGKSYPIDIQNAKKAGADEYIVKPYGLQQIIESVGKALA